MNECKEKCSKDKYDDIFEAVLSTEYPEINSAMEDQTKSAPKISGKKRQLNLDEKYIKNSEKKKRTETTRDRLLDWNSFYTSQKFGVWIQCTKCNKWRKCLEYEEIHEVPKDWCCSMSRSGVRGCDDPEKVDYDDFSPVDLIPGSIVWAKLYGYPWWPGMIEDDPDVEEYYWLESNGSHYYNVTFLDDKVTHAWVLSTFVRPFVHGPPHQHTYLSSKQLKDKYEHLIKAAAQKANDAITMPIKERLQKFSFAHTYKGKWSKPLETDSDEGEDNLIEELFKEVDDIESIKSSDSDYKSVFSELTSEDVDTDASDIECIQVVNSTKKNEMHKPEFSHGGHFDAEIKKKDNTQYKNAKGKPIPSNKTVMGKNKNVNTDDPYIMIKNDKSKDLTLKSKNNGKIINSEGAKVFDHSKERKHTKIIGVEWSCKKRDTTKQIGNQKEMTMEVGVSEKSLENNWSKLEFKPPIKQNEKTADMENKFDKTRHTTEKNVHNLCEYNSSLKAKYSETEDEIKDALVLPNKKTISEYVDEEETAVNLNGEENSVTKFKTTEKNTKINKISKQQKKNEEKNGLSNVLQKNLMNQASDAGNKTNSISSVNNNKETNKQCGGNGKQTNSAVENISSLKFQAMDINEDTESTINNSKRSIMKNTKEMDSLTRDLKDTNQNNSKSQNPITKNENTKIAKKESKLSGKNSQIANGVMQIPAKSFQTQKGKHEEGTNNVLKILEKNFMNLSFDANRSTYVNNNEESTTKTNDKARESGKQIKTAHRNASSLKFQQMTRNEDTKSAVNNSKRNIIKNAKETDLLTEDLKDTPQSSSNWQHPSAKQANAKKQSKNFGKKSLAGNGDTQTSIKKGKHENAAEKSNGFKQVTKQKGTNKKDTEGHLENISYATSNGTGGNLEGGQSDDMSLDEDMQDGGFSMTLDEIVQELDREDSPPFESQQSFTQANG